MDEKDSQLLGYTYLQIKWIREMQINCKVCKCYGVERCGEHAKKFTTFKNN